MEQKIAPIACRPWMLNGLSERMIVSHYENNYGAAVRLLNAVRGELRELCRAGVSGGLIKALRREELAAMDSVALHELYFEGLGGDGRITPRMAARLEADFGSVEAWRRDFVGTARAMCGGSGWVHLSYCRRDRRLRNHAGMDDTQAIVDASPILVLDMYEHAYQIDFGANSTAYVDAFMRNLDWTAVEKRLIDAEGAAQPVSTLPELARPVSINELSAAYDAADIARLGLPSVSVEELFDALAENENAQVVDARPRHYFSRNFDMMRRAIWHDPNQVDAWSSGLSKSEPVFVYCAYGYHVGCGVTAALRARGFDAKYLRGGLSAWYAAGGERALKAPEPATIEV
jgi:Fe-Mn family superoxide dismutase